MIIDKEILDARIEKIRSNLIELKELSTLSQEEFLKDIKNIAAAERLLQICIEAMLDIGNHLIAAKGFEQPSEYRDIFEILGKRGTFSKELTRKLLEMAGLRNRLVHVYMDVDPRKIYDFIQEYLGDLQDFIKQTLMFCDKEAK